MTESHVPAAGIESTHALTPTTVPLHAGNDSTAERKPVTLSLGTGEGGGEGVLNILLGYPG